MQSKVKHMKKTDRVIVFKAMFESKTTTKGNQTRQTLYKNNTRQRKKENTTTFLL